MTRSWVLKWWAWIDRDWLCCASVLLLPVEDCGTRTKWNHFISGIQSLSFRGNTLERAWTGVVLCHCVIPVTVVALLVTWKVLRVAVSQGSEQEKRKRAKIICWRLIAKQFFFVPGPSREQNWINTAGPHPPRHRGSGRRDPGCYGKGHPDFTLMDGSDSAAEEELSWAPWQQATEG